jgi:hypothetical protein
VSNVAIVFSDSGRKKVNQEKDLFFQEAKRVTAPKLSFFHKEDQAQRDCLEDILAPEKKIKKIKKKKEKKEKNPDKGRRSMFDEELDKYLTYEEYLDSLVSEEDHKYLEDEEMARQIAELGYRQVFLRKIAELRYRQVC